MTITPVSPPTPPNGDLERALYVWIPTVGGTYDPMGSSTAMQNFLNFCSTNGVNTVFLDMWLYLGGSNWTSAHATTVQEFLHYCSESGIRVMALAGNTNWGVDQQWVAEDILLPIRNLNLMAQSNTTYPSEGFKGLQYDVEYWTVSGYSAAVSGSGLCDLMNASRKYLNIPVGCYADNYLANTSSNAQTYTYNGVTQIEGLQLVANADFVAVACYYDLASYQEPDLQPWFNYASQAGLALNKGLYCGSLTDSGYGSESYYTGASGAKATMEAQHTLISNFFTASPNTNMTFLGQSIEQYSSYDTMT